jgi:hypothetical protein
MYVTQDRAQPGKALVRRASTCAGCHVGSPAKNGIPARDVDHDLIAAGHPRLNFEFSAYLDNMPKHWRTDVEPESKADFPARAWAVGQLATAKAAADLLKDRALNVQGALGKQPDRPAAWPEFTELDCFACHHTLRDQSWRSQGRTTTALGLPRWGTWYYPILETFAATEAGQGDELLTALKGLRTAMERPRPDPADVAARAGAVSALIKERLDVIAEKGFDEPRLKALTGAFEKLQKAGAVRTWDEATQRYLALVPLTQALRSLAPGAPAPVSSAELESLRNALSYPKGFDSPKTFEPPKPRP